jgi:MerR family transcriptional regulator, copper efflux regulator
MPLSEKLKVIDRKFDEIAEKMRQLEEIKTYLTAKRNRITQESGNSRTAAISRSLEG